MIINIKIYQIPLKNNKKFQQKIKSNNFLTYICGKSTICDDAKLIIEAETLAFLKSS